MNIFAKPTGYGWHRYGPCDVCGVKPDSTYMLSSGGTVAVPTIFGCKVCVEQEIDKASADALERRVMLDKIKAKIGRS